MHYFCVCINRGLDHIYAESCVTLKKVQVGNDQENAQSVRNFHSKNRDGKNYIDNWVLILRKHIVSRVSGYFPIGGHSVTGCFKFKVMYYFFGSISVLICKSRKHLHEMYTPLIPNFI